MCGYRVQGLVRERSRSSAGRLRSGLRISSSFVYMDGSLTFSLRTVVRSKSGRAVYCLALRHCTAPAPTWKGKGQGFRQLLQWLNSAGCGSLWHEVRHLHVGRLQGRRGGRILGSRQRDCRCLCKAGRNLFRSADLGRCDSSLRGRAR